MIRYNMRYRGPLEYDKFILNALQFHNQVNLLLRKKLKDPTSPANTIAALAEEVNAKFEEVAGSNSLSERFYHQSMTMKEE